MITEIISGCGCCGSVCNPMYKGDSSQNTIVAYQKIGNGTVVVYPDSNHSYDGPVMFNSFLAALSSWGPVLKVGQVDNACSNASFPPLQAAMDHLNAGGVLLIIGEYEGCQDPSVNPFIISLGSKLTTSRVEGWQTATKNSEDPLLQNFPPVLNFKANGVISC